MTMQNYGALFSRIYNLRWAGFATHLAPLIRTYYESLFDDVEARRALPILDVACGTGQLALHFLEHGYSVTGLDQSVDMLGHARQNCAAHVEAGRATFVRGDAAGFTVGGSFGLAVSTFDALNHLPDLAALRGCFRSVIAALAPEGVFIFDLNTRRGLLENWNNLSVIDSSEVVIINRGIYDGGERAFTHISGFIRRDDGLYERFVETFFNTVFDLAEVGAALREVGFRTVHCASGSDLATPVADPESLGRAFFVARV